MWDDTTPRAREIAAWLDSPMDLDEFYGSPRRRVPASSNGRRMKALLVGLGIAAAGVVGYFAYEIGWLLWLMITAPR